MTEQLRSVSWLASTIVGLLLGFTLTWLRTQRYFFFAGAAILAVIIIVAGVWTIRRRTRHPELVRTKTNWKYVLWALVLIVLTGPVQLVYVADDISELSIKSLVLSVGFIVGIHELDRALVNGSKAEYHAES